MGVHLDRTESDPAEGGEVGYLVQKDSVNEVCGVSPTYTSAAFASWALHRLFFLKLGFGSLSLTSLFLQETDETQRKRIWGVPG